MAETTEKIVIIGSGPAGYTAAIYAARANLRPVVFAGGPHAKDPQRVPGGQLMVTTDVENYPGFHESITGPELMERFQKQAERFGTRIHMENVLRVDFSRRPFRIEGESPHHVYFAETLILATGATAKWLHIPGEDEFKNRGVSACATCDGAFFKGQDVLVVGGGDTAMEEATYLSKIVRHVTVIHRRDTFRASKIMADRVLSNPKISVMWHSAVERVLGTHRGMTGATVKHLQTGEMRELAATGLFVAIGHSPNTDLIQGAIELLPNGYVKTRPGSTYTNIPGVFACGDLQDSNYRQAVTAAGSGCMAAIDAERWMIEHGQ